MAESYKAKRAVFPRGGQYLFLERIGKQLTVSDMAQVCHCSERTIRDWRREKFSMSLSAVNALSTQTQVPIPKNVRTRDAYANNAQASKMGLAAVIKKYGHIPRNEKYREEQWRRWWKSTGIFQENSILETLPIHKPERDTKLAEFIGIMMGDGGVSSYQVVITLHHVDDLAYASFVVNLMEKLFHITPKIYHRPKKSVNNIVASRKELVEYLHELDLPIGNKVKQHFDIPMWIKRNPEFAVACLRGLVDTDGCIFTHRYRVKNKWYAYKKLSFTSASRPLQQSVYALFQKLGFHPRLSSEDVRLDRVDDIRQYFSVVGSHNPKHLRRYENTVG